MLPSGTDGKFLSFTQKTEKITEPLEKHLTIVWSYLFTCFQHIVTMYANEQNEDV
jgi:hypothetical protein